MTYPIATWWEVWEWEPRASPPRYVPLDDARGLAKDEAFAIFTALSKERRDVLLLKCSRIVEGSAVCRGTAP